MTNHGIIPPSKIKSSSSTQDDVSGAACVGPARLKAGSMQNKRNINATFITNNTTLFITLFSGRIVMSDTQNVSGVTIMMFSDEFLH